MEVAYHISFKLELTISSLNVQLLAQVSDPNILNNPSKIIQSVCNKLGGSGSVAVKTHIVQIAKIVDASLYK